MTKQEELKGGKNWDFIHGYYGQLKEGKISEAQLIA